MTHKIKILTAVLVALMALAVVLPETDNYYQVAIDLIAAEHGLQSDGLQLKSGSYQNFMHFKTVQIELITAQSRHIQAEIQQMPFIDWQLTQFKIID